MFTKISNYRTAFAISPPKDPRFKPEDVPSLAGRVVLITGGNRGCGLLVATYLTQKGAKVYIGSRSAKNGEAAVQHIKATVGDTANIDYIQMDLSDLDSVSQAVKEFASKETRLNLLILNAAVQEEAASQKTVQGYGIHFGVNVLAHHLLTQRLLPLLLRTAKLDSQGSVRIVTLASSAHYFAPKGGIDFDSLARKADQTNPKGKQWSSMQCYGHSKLANILISKHLASLYGDDGVWSLSVHPGNISTTDEDWLSKRLLWPVDPYGAINVLYAATSEEVVEQNFNGKYVVPWAKVFPPHPQAEDLLVAERLYTWLQSEIVDLK